MRRIQPPYYPCGTCTTRRIQPPYYRGVQRGAYSPAPKQDLYPFHCWPVIPPGLTFPFHCWVYIPVCPCAPVLSVAGLLSIIHPFHCWVYSRFTVGQCSSSSFPVSLLAIVPRPCALSLIMLNIPDSGDVRNTASLMFPVCQKRGIYGRENVSRINPSPPRNRAIMLNKPDTESTVAQGRSESQELSFSDQNCKCQLFAHPGITPAQGPWLGQFLLVISGLGRLFPGWRRAETPYKQV